MLCALTNPLLEAWTDLGEIEPVIVFMRLNFVWSVVVLALTGSDGIMRKSAKRKLTLFSFIESEFTFVN
jgi:hypothetical protein